LGKTDLKGGGGREIFIFIKRRHELRKVEEHWCREYKKVIGRTNKETERTRDKEQIRKERKRKINS
jgi:hypothetical protein